jgi:hypothetical protein
MKDTLTPMQQKFADIVINSLKLNVVQNGLGTRLAEQIVEAVQAVEPTAKYVEVEEGSVVFYKDSIKQAVVDQLSKTLANYEQKTIALRNALLTLK